MGVLSNIVLGCSALASVVLAQQPGVPTHPPTFGVIGQNGANHTVAGNGPKVMKDGKYAISAEGITIYFVPYGASVSNLFITDRHNVSRDVILGWDNATYYSEDLQHPYFGPIVGK